MTVPSSPDLPQRPEKKSLELRQTGFLFVSAFAVILMFFFVIVPYLAPRPPALAGTQAVDFNLELISGGDRGDRIGLANLRGKTVVIDFWASWCQPCRQQSKVLASVSKRLGPEVYLLGIATSDQRGAAEAFVLQENLPYPNAFDEGNQVGADLKIMELPTLVIVDSMGVIRVSKNEVLGAEELLSLIESVGTKNQ